MSGTVDILMITFNMPAYVERSLSRLLHSCDERTRVWLWHNGTDEETLAVTQRFAADDRVHRFHHSVENQRLTAPTNWMWSASDADYVSKVDDDCLVPDDWLAKLRHAHEQHAGFGAIGGCRLLPEDLEPDLLAPKIETYRGGIKLFRSHWVQGSSYLLKREWIDRKGLLAPGQSWTNWCVQAALAGAINGFLWPQLFEDHMDDPRSQFTLIKTDADLAMRKPLSAAHSGLATVEKWERRMRADAHELQAAPVGLQHYRGWRRKVGNLRWRLSQKRSA